jgi:hypothetical protein
MATLTIRNIPEDAKLRLRQIAAAHGRSMEEHLRQMIINAGFDDERPAAGVRDVHRPFGHFEPDATVLSSGSAVIDRLWRLGHGLEFEAPPREAEPLTELFDPKDYL